MLALLGRVADVLPLVLSRLFSYPASVNYTAAAAPYFQYGGCTPSFLFILFMGAKTRRHVTLSLVAPIQGYSPQIY